MGYRSEVAIKCEEKAYERFREVFIKEDLFINPDKILYDKENQEYYIYWDWIKWYEDYEGVNAIIKVMEALDEEHNYCLSDELGYKFIRLGEDDDDVETRANDWSLELWIIRKIDIPEDLEEVN